MSYNYQKKPGPKFFLGKVRSIISTKNKFTNVWIENIDDPGTEPYNIGVPFNISAGDMVFCEWNENYSTYWACNTLIGKLKNDNSGTIVCYNGQEYSSPATDASSEYVLFSTYPPKDYTNKAKHIRLIDFPNELIDQGSQNTGVKRYTGTVLTVSKEQNVKSLFIQLDKDQDTAVTKCYYTDKEKRWFFGSDRVSFELNGRNAVAIKKIPPTLNKSFIDTDEILTEVPKELFDEVITKDSLNIFQTRVMEIGEKYKSSILKSGKIGKGQSFENNAILNDLNVSPKAFSNITNHLYDDDEKYQSSMLMRFKPFFDGIVPYLYAEEIEKNPSELENLILDYCDLLLSVIRARKINEAFDVEIDTNNLLFKRFAAIIKYYVIGNRDRMPKISEKAKLEAAIALSSFEHPTDYALALFSGTAWETLYNNYKSLTRDDFNGKDARLVGKFCELIRNIEGCKTSANETLLSLLDSGVSALGVGVLDGFISSELNDNISLLLKSRELISNGPKTYDNLVSGIDALLNCSAESNEDEKVLLNSLYEKARNYDCDFDLRLLANLISIYAETDVFKARFLYAYFIKHRAIKNLPVFEKIFENTEDKGIREDDFANSVVFDAFLKLSSSQLFDFLVWASPLFMSAWGGNYVCDLGTNTASLAEARTFSYYFAKILMNPTSFGNWNSFREWFRKPEENNLYSVNNKHLLNVCARVMLNVFENNQRESVLRVDCTEMLRELFSKINSDRPSLLYYAFECIIMSKAIDRNNNEIATRLLNAISKNRIIIPDRDATVPKEFDDFSIWCYKQIKDNSYSGALYADLLIKIRGDRITWDEIEAVAPLTTNKAFISNRLFVAFEDSSAPKNAKEVLLNALKNRNYQSKTSAYIGKSFHETWKEVLLCEEEALSNFRQTCINVLKEYPKSDELRKYLTSFNDNISKLRLCERFLGIYSEQMIGGLFKKSLNFDAKDLCESRELRNAYISFIGKQCLSQLVFNYDYEDFYIYRRYLKLAVIDALNNKTDINSIKAIAEEHNHAQLLESFDFNSFSVILQDLCEELKHESVQREHLLFSFITENMSSYFDHYGTTELRNLKPILRHFDFREIQSNFFLNFCRILEENDFQFPDNTYEGQLSDELSEIIDTLHDLSVSRNQDKRDEFQPRLKKTKGVFENKIYSLAISGIIDEVDEITDKGFWMSVILANQLPSKIIAEARRRVINYAKDKRDGKAVSENPKKFALSVIDKLGTKGKGYYYPSADKCKEYLSYLDIYLNKSRPITKDEVDRIDVTALPQVWRSEAEKFKASYESGTFAPDEIAFRSFGNAENALTFPNKIKELRSVSPDIKQKAMSLIDYTDGDTYRELAKNFKEDTIKNSLIPAGIKLTICLELNQRCGLTFSKKDLLYISESLSLEDWISNYKAIYAVLQTSFKEAYDFLEGIAKKLQIDSLESCSIDTLLCELENPVTESLDDEFVNNIINSRYDLAKLRLKLAYEGYSKTAGSNEAYVYFTIKNCGSLTVNLNDAITVSNELSRADVVISELRPGWTCGIRCTVCLDDIEDTNPCITISDKKISALPLCCKHLTSSDFEEVKHENIVTDIKSGIRCTRSADEIINEYSANVTVYKEAIREAIKNKNSATIIYAYDVTEIIASAFIDDASANNFIRVISGEIEKEEDRLCLQYIAKCQSKQTGLDALSRLRDKFGNDVIDDFRERAKDITLVLNENNDFTSVFFCKTFDYLAKNKTELDILTELARYFNKIRSVDEILSDLKKLHLEEMQALEKGLPDILKSKHINLYGNAKFVQGDDNSVNNTYNISAKTINSFLTLLSGNPEDFAQAFLNIPKINDYLGGNSKKVIDRLNKISGYLNEDGEIIYDDDIDAYESRVNAVEECYDEIKPLIEEAHSRRIKDITSVITIDDFISTNDELWSELLGIDVETVKKLRALPNEYSSALSFAVIIHNIFNKIYANSKDNAEINADDLDFCPSAILYCKVVEAMLKDTHTGLYQKSFANMSIDSRKANSKLFGEVEKSDPSLTIGTYLFFISTININGINEEAKYNRLNPIRFVKEQEIKLLANGSQEKAKMWKKHACELPVIASTRNKSAHELKPMSKARFDWLIKVLFENGELLRIWDLANSD